MSRWPVVDPPPHGTLHSSLRAKPLDPPVYDGPINVLNEINGTTQAINAITINKNHYNELHPPALIEEPVLEPLPAPGPEPKHDLPTGRPVSYSDGVGDPDLARRVNHRPIPVVIKKVIEGEP
jgi:hypothetical protein